ncbi:WD40-like Beta Propeller Repeat [Flexibacter flexilis DSM 6793]|uniref:WD40-like Beta Propeller Repeat n=1 Tax=Flexibacter flexilis DSM 6793 TaxID=927664 RepID=A0A1I1IUU0_9BACT|nr:OmpA family protein [Flexibacter flexilis]SFC40014.1 WD40-like Beta Propeller Repeat [Flexibacter flexilis DSM 6793]
MKSRFLMSMFVLTCAASVAWAQPLTSSNKKAQSAYDEANVLLQKREYDKGIELMEKAVNRDPNFADAHLALGHLYMFLMPKNEKNMAVIFGHFEAYLQYAPQQRESSEVAHFLASLYMDYGKYEQAIKWLEWSIAHPKRNLEQTDNAEQLLADAKFAKEAVLKPLPITIQALPPAVNHFPLQYFPTITADKQTLVYVGRKGFTSAYDEDLYVATLKNNEWQRSTPIPNINTDQNEGTACISGDGRSLVFSSCGTADSKGGCDIYISYKIGNQWTKPQNIEAINSEYWDSQPSLSADGKTIYFSSNRAGGIGKHDIWGSHQNEQGQWQTPVNLGDKINTPADELAPFIHANGQTLFFSSSGYAGMGKLDLYLSNNINGQWQTPENLGYPLNTAKDETAISITADGKTAFFSREQRATRQTSAEGSVLAWFEVPNTWNIVHKSNYLKGTVFDNQTKEKIGATVELIDLASGQKMYSVEADPKTGEYLMVITEGKNYALYVNQKGYLFKSLTFNYLQPKTTNQPIEMDIPLEKIQAGSLTVLNNISFESGKYELLPSSVAELKKIQAFMKENPSIEIEIAGHTDDVGSKTANIELSQKRAASVVKYLTQNGITAKRLQAKGYGETRPLNTNTGEGERQLNRRIEFKILKTSSLPKK